MRKAEYIVEMLLEDTANGTTLLFGPLQPALGTAYANLEKAVEIGQRQSRQPTDFSTALNSMLGRGYSFVVQKNPTDVAVYSRQPQVYTGEGALERVQKLYGISPEARVIWKQSYEAAGHPVSVQDVFVERKAVKPGAQPGAAPTAQPIQAAPVTFGLGVQKRTQAVADPGVAVVTVDKGGPAAKAGIQAGDRIVAVGPFQTDQGTFGPWAIKDAAEFKRVGLYMQAGHAVPMRLVRGGSEFRLALIPEQAGAAKAAPETEHLTVAEIAQAKGSQPQAVRQDLSRSGGRAKDFAPNAPEPASVTGNQKPNVSTLT